MSDIYLVDDHVMVREGMRAVLEASTRQLPQVFAARRALLK